MQRDLLLTQELSTAHLRLAMGDREGRIAIWNAPSRQVTDWMATGRHPRSLLSLLVAAEETL